MLSIKGIGVLLIGVFVGAVTVEILNRKNPKLIKKVRDEANKTVKAAGKSLTAMKNAFMNGFSETAKSKTAS